VRSKSCILSGSADIAAARDGEDSVSPDGAAQAAASRLATVLETAGIVLVVDGGATTTGQVCISAMSSSCSADKDDGMVGCIACESSKRSNALSCIPASNARLGFAGCVNRRQRSK
jgi:hypothetical protein